ncbi:MAG: hypothetical protein IJX66_03900 [Lachnospiraceae bacterium]|nr:hypothetical protein [Lachnospiraceae bacterium]
MVKFLRFVKADLAESTQDFEVDFVNCLQKSVQSIKENREMEVHFMGWYEMLREERTAGKAEFVLELLYDLGAVSEELETQIMNEQKLDVLSRWHKLAAKSDSIEQFLENM